MRSEKQHIDDFFRQKEEAFTPDEQQATAHWQQMQKQLADAGTGASAIGKNGSHIIRQTGKFLGGLLTVAIIVILVINLNRSSKKASTKTTKQQATVVTPQTKPVTTPEPLSDSTQPTSQAATIVTNSVTPAGKQRPPRIPAMTLISPPITKAEEFKSETQSAEDLNSEWSNNKKILETKAPKPNAKASLHAFFEELKQEEQTFYIQANRDTTLIAKEGTQLVIPANILYRKDSVAKGRVKIMIREYYKNEDIIAAKLTTTSNGKQLVTGGMVHISVQQDGEHLTVNPTRTVTIKMPVDKDKYDNDMELFTGKELHAGTDNSTSINWVQAGSRALPFDNPDMKVLDFNIGWVNPYAEIYRKKHIAKFYISARITMPKAAIIAQLKERFNGYYDVIRLKRHHKQRGVPQYNTGYPGQPRFEFNMQHTIDSVYVNVITALMAGGITKKDSLRYMALLKSDSVYLKKYITMHQNYKFALSRFDWINCDRFYLVPRQKVTVTASLGENTNAKEYFSMLVFRRYQSVMKGYRDGKSIYFENIPENEPAYLLTLTINDDKVVSNIQPITTSNTVISNLVFEPTTPEQFKQKLQALFTSEQQ